MVAKNSDKSAADLVGEKKEGVKDEAATELAKEAVKEEARLDTGTKASDPDPKVGRFAHVDVDSSLDEVLKGGLKALEAAIDKKDGLPEEKVASLLVLERNGQNRTEYVKLLMKRLDLKGKDLARDLPQAGGPDTTNDTTNLTEL